MRTMNTCSLLLGLVAVATAVVSVVGAFSPSPLPSSADADPDPYPCPWRPVANPEDPFIQKLGRWAVLQLHVVMRFNKVDSAKLQGVGQCNTVTRNYYYELFINASLRGIGTSPGDDHKYRAVVYVVNFTEPQQLMSFKPDYPPHRQKPPAAN